MENIPDKNKRIEQSDNIGLQMYGKNWFSILNALNELDPDYASYVREIAYGSVYPRSTLSLPQREIAAISVLTQLNLKPQLKSHIIAALNVGISREEIIELFIHLSMYIGFPITLSGLRVAKEVFDSMDNKK